MAMAVGVLCARVRVEEKQIITALGDAGAVAMPVPPTSMPLPPCPAPQDIAALGDSTGEDASDTPSVIIDRATNRQVARPLVRLFRQADVQIIDAGMASQRNRQEVATAWGAASLPRPATLVAFSEATGVQAASHVGFPSTLLPLIPGTASTTLHDADTADAVIEHRVVLGSADEAVVLVQAGAPVADESVRVHLVGGQPIAFDGSLCDEAVSLAQRAAGIIEADLVSIEIAVVNGEMVVWDAVPVTDFRKSTLIGEQTMGEAIARLALSRMEEPQLATGEGVRDVIALSA